MNKDIQIYTEKLLSFAIKTSIGFIPVIGPVIASGIFEIENHIKDKESLKITSMIIRKMKDNKKNMIHIRHENSNLMEAKNSKVDLVLWFEIYINSTGLMNASEKMRAVTFKLAYEHIQKNDITEENKYKIYKYIYNYICECESETWVEEDARALVYHEISLFFSTRFKDHNTAILFSIKSIEETENIHLRYAFFLEGYIAAWYRRTTVLINKSDNALTQKLIAEKFYKTLINTIISIEEIEESKGLDFSEREKFTCVSCEIIGRSKNLQINFLISCIVDLLKHFSEIENVLFDLSDKFYDTYESLTDKEEKLLLPDWREATKKLYDEMFKIT